MQTWYAPQAELAQALAERITPLPEQAKVDMGQFGPPEPEVTGAVIDGPTLARPQAEQGPVVMDLGEMTFSLDDFDDEEEVEQDVDEEARDAVASAPLDSGHAAPADPDSVAVEHHVVWDEIDPGPWQPATSVHDWVEIDALLGFLDEFPHVTEVTWTEAHLLAEDEMGVRHLDVVVDLLDSRGLTLHGPQDHPHAVVTAEPVALQRPLALVPDLGHVPDDEFGPLPTVPAHLLPTDDPFS
ncbi:hypothetical protein [Nocardioides sp. InS609-2]|uniref:hypothetical protein n=1 Tax=Nocardioides sp. InS609-2 TaxID=2760705 RepID=UPI0020BD5B0B|nr:hypothetical protein [Nocardioides sp. InS609-2]